MDMPDLIALFPLPNHVLLPGYPVPFRVFEPRYQELVRHLSELPADDRFVAMPRLSPGWQADYAGSPPFEHVCALALVRHIRSIDAGQFLISVEGLVRCRLHEAPSPHAFRQARPSAMSGPECGLSKTQVRSEVDRLCQGLRTLSLRLQAPLGPLESLLQEAADPLHLLDRLGCLLVETPDARQVFLECESVEGRLEMLRGLVASSLSLEGQAGLRPSEN